MSVGSMFSLTYSSGVGGMLLLRTVANSILLSRSNLWRRGYVGALGGLLSLAGSRAVTHHLLSTAKSWRRRGCLGWQTESSVPTANSALEQT